MAPNSSSVGRMAGGWRRRGLPATGCVIHLWLINRTKQLLPWKPNVASLKISAEAAVCPTPSAFSKQRVGSVATSAKIEGFHAFDELRFGARFDVSGDRITRPKNIPVLGASVRIFMPCTGGSCYRGLCSSHCRNQQCKKNQEAKHGCALLLEENESGFTWLGRKNRRSALQGKGRDHDAVEHDGPVPRHLTIADHSSRILTCS